MSEQANEQTTDGREPRIPRSRRNPGAEAGTGTGVAGTDTDTKACVSGCAAKLLNEICRGHPHALTNRTHTRRPGRPADRQTDSHMRHKGLIVHSCKLFGCHRHRLSQLGRWELPSN